MVAVAFSFLLLVMLTNLVLVQYGRGLVRAAVDEGVRAGARFDADPVGACEERAKSVLDGIGKLGSDITITCQPAGDQVQATANAKFEGWLPVVPTFEENATAISRKEVAPQ